MIPAVLAFCVKLIILYFSVRAKRQNRLTYIFNLVVTLSMVMNVAEAIGLQQRWMSELIPLTEALVYYSAGIFVVALLIYLASLITFESLTFSRNALLLVPLSIYVLILQYLLLATPLIITGLVPFGDYSYIRAPGRWYFLYEFFLIAGCFIFTFLPLYGLREKNTATGRNQCKIWVITATPASLLVVMVMLFLHFNIHIINATVTLPLLLALYLAAVGYAIHYHRIIEIDFYIPGTRIHSRKRALYTKLLAFRDEASRMGSLNPVINHLGSIIKSPVCLVTEQEYLACTAHADPIKQFPRSQLREITRMAVLPEINEGNPELFQLMRSHSVGAIVPFYPHSKYAARWLLLGEAFTQELYTSLDFRILEELFAHLAVLFLDHEMATRVANKPEPTSEPLLERLPLSAHKSLDASIAELESKIIKQTLEQCGGKQVEAAKQLGMRPNTLHYKLKRYGLV